MKIMKIVGIIVLTAFCIIIKELYFRINLIYENGRYYDENTNIVYKSQTIIALFCLLALSILVLIFIIFLKNKMDKLKKIK
jgi:hypothetical protein